MITLAYIIPNIYVFMRIWQNFINKDHKLQYTIIYVLFALIYPVSNLFSDESKGILPTLFNTAGNYILPFYLYLFLSVFLYDIFLLINLIFRLVPASIRIKTSYRKAVLTTILCISILVVIGGAVNFNTIRVSEYNIDIPQKNSRINHLKIAFVADFHLQENTNTKFVERFAEKIGEINPDLMVFGGDIVEGDRLDENMNHFEDLFRAIKTRYGVYGVLGNHEYYGGQDKGNFFDKAGIKILCDTIVTIDSAFYLGGRYDSHFRGRKSIDDFMSDEKDFLPFILIDHRPTELEQVSKTAVDVQLSGHTHNGQMFPINLITRQVYTLSWGYRKIRNTHFFVTSGIRLWGPPVRTVGKSEIMVINISFSGQ